MFNNKDSLKKMVILFIILITLGVLLFVVFSFLNSKKAYKNNDGNSSQYYIVFDSQGGTKFDSVLMREGYITLPTDITKDGYSFIGWTVNDELVEEKYYINKSTRLKAKWEKSQLDFYTVTFNTGTSQIIEPILVREGDKIDMPAPPLKDNYIFDYWECDGYSFDFNQPITGNIDLRAKWKRIHNNLIYYKVDFDQNGGETPVISQLVIDGDLVIKPVNPVRTGFKFVEWQLDGIAFDFDSPISEDIILKAVWEQNTIIEERFSVKFDLNGGDDSIESQSILSGGKVSKPITPTKSGYTFAGWLDNGKAFNFNTKITKNITLTASWTKNSITPIYYIVSFNLNGGSGSIKSKSILSGGKVSKPSNPTRSDYTFNGWLYNGSSFNFNTSITKNMTLTASWTKNSTSSVYYTVVFNNNYNSTTKKSVKSGSTVSKPSTPSRDGYTFIGWYTDSKKEYNFNTKVTSNLTLYALWAPKLNYTNNTTGKWIYINNPETLSSDTLLADSNYGNKSLFKATFSGTAEVFYSHCVGKAQLNNIYYAIRVYNPNSSSVTLKINKCGAVMGGSVANAWKQYYNDTCSIAGKSYTIPSNKSIIIYHNGNNYVYGDNNTQKSVTKVYDAFDGVLNMTASKEVYMAAIAFKDITKTYNAVYTGNVVDNYLNGSTKLTPARMYSGTYNKLPILTHNMTYDIFDQTPSGVLPVSYTATNNSTYITSPVDSFSSSDKNKTVWRTHLIGGSIDTSNSTNFKVLYHDKHFVGDFIKLSVPISSSSSMTLGPYKSYSDPRTLYHAKSGNLMRGWPHNWGNWAVHYKENITINNNSSTTKTVTFRLAELISSQTVIVNYNNRVTEYKKNGYQNIWTVTIRPGKSVTVPAEIVLGGHSNGGITRELVLD